MKKLMYVVKPIISPTCGCAIGSCGNKPID